MGRLVLLCLATAVLACVPTAFGAASIQYWFSYESGSVDCTSSTAYPAGDEFVVPSDNSCYRLSGSSASVKVQCTGMAWTLSEYDSADCTGSADLFNGTSSSSCSVGTDSQNSYRKVSCGVDMPTQWRSSSFSSAGCTGVASSYSVSDMNRCRNSYASGGFGRNTSSQTVCDSTGQYSVSYSDLDCQTPSRITRMPAFTCQQTRTNRWVTSACVAGSTGTDIGFTFPPSGSIQSTSYSYTNDSNPYFCAVESNTFIEAETASRTGSCVIDGDFSSASYCSGNGAFSASLHFADRTCTVVKGAEIRPMGCNGFGTQRACVDADTIPVELPTIGWIRYSRDGCTSRPGDIPSITAVVPGACIDNHKYTCSTPDATTGIAAFTDTRYQNSDCTGQVLDASTYTGDGTTCSDLRYKYACAFVSAGVGGIVGILNDPTFDPTGSTAFVASASSLLASLLVVASVFVQRML